ncbi:MAG TPA: AmmeMemoRadiSam system radical SAM enzyme [bacterium]|nr:AmmeMemoRadiSam system radical SAM enzyme [bacterium]
MKEALFYKKENDGKVLCELCPHFCRLRNGQVGVCGVRQNREGVLYSLVFGKAIAINVDPIEKKPLFHVAPGSSSLSVATAGCNFHCMFCQNHNISQLDSIDLIDQYSRDVSPQQIVAAANERSCDSIAYTYTEPTIYFEYAYETAKLAHAENILNVFVTNGYINPAPLKHISPYLDAANVDLKSFNDKFYRKLIGAKLPPILEILRLMKKLNIWIEITTLVIPGENDSVEEFQQIAGFIKNELGEETPWHISRFYPNYKMMSYSPTPVSTIQQAHTIGREQGLRYVYVGNVPGEISESTFCYNCGEMVIERRGFQVRKKQLQSGKCQHCQTPIDGLGL